MARRNKERKWTKHIVIWSLSSTTQWIWYSGYCKSNVYMKFLSSAALYFSGAQQVATTKTLEMGQVVTFLRNLEKSW